MQENSTSIKKSLHGLKSSLTILYGYLQLIEKEVEKNNDNKEKIVELISKAKTASTNLENKIEEIEELEKG